MNYHISQLVDEQNDGMWIETSGYAIRIERKNDYFVAREVVEPCGYDETPNDCDYMEAMATWFKNVKKYGSGVAEVVYQGASYPLKLRKA